jgi:hypothetical protein
MIQLKSNQRLYISKDLQGYVDKLVSDGTVPLAVDFLKLGFSYGVMEELHPSSEFRRHEITANTEVLGDGKPIIEAVAQWHAREIGVGRVENERELLDMVCRTGISGGRMLQKRWQSKSKGQVQSDIPNLA